LNTAPLIWSFVGGSFRNAVELITDTAPARCADMLARGEVEAALVPVIEYHRIPEILIVPDVCVGSRKKVRSVVLVTRCDRLKDIRTVALDRSSRTSAALLRIIFGEFVGTSPIFTESAPDLLAMLEEADAALIIGDPAMTFSRDDLNVHDMAALWREHTGLGFVFAMWMVSERANRNIGTLHFAAARDEGIRNVEDIVASYAASLDLPKAELREYLLDNISFEVDEEMRAGLELYYRLAHKHGVIDHVRPLNFAKPG
jgi:chorismate dehydratase